MIIIRDLNKIEGIGYDFDIPETEFEEEERVYTITGKFHIGVSSPEDAIIGEIKLRGFNTELDRIEKNLFKGFTVEK